MGDEAASGPPEWDEELGCQLVGSLLLIGLTYLNVAGELERQEQVFGRVLAADATGIRIELQGSREGGTYSLPPDPRAFQTAEPGQYRLRTTGEVVVNPDFTAAWTINSPRDSETPSPPPL